MSYLPPEKPKPRPGDGPSPARIAIWVVVSLVGIYLVVTGLVGALT